MDGLDTVKVVTVEELGSVTLEEVGAVVITEVVELCVEGVTGAFSSFSGWDELKGVPGDDAAGQETRDDVVETETELSGGGDEDMG